MENLIDAAGLPLIITAVVGLYAAIRVVMERSTLRKLPYLNVLNFAVAGSIALLIPHPLSIAAAAAYFVGSTFESNAIASTFAVEAKHND